MVVLDGGLVFIKAIDGSGGFKDKHYIAGVLKNAIKEIGHEKIFQVIIDNAKIFWTPCVVHTFNLALKNICAAKNTKKNEVTFEECSGITRMKDASSAIRVIPLHSSNVTSFFSVFFAAKYSSKLD